MVRRRVQSSFNLADEEDFDPDVVGGLADLGVVNSVSDEIEGLRGTGEQPLPEIEPPQYEDVRQIPVPGYEGYTEDQLSGLSGLVDTELPEPRQMFAEGFDNPENEEIMAMRQQDSERLPGAREMIEGGYEPPINEEIQAIRDRDVEDENLVNAAWDAGYGSQWPDYTLDDVRADVKENPDYVQQWMDSIKPQRREPTEEETVIANRAINNEPPTNTEVRKDQVPVEASPVAGASDIALQNPYVRQEIERLGGIGAIDPEQEALMKEWEKIATTSYQDLNGNQKSLLQKLFDGELGTADKIALGLAILAPVVIGAMYGSGGIGIGVGAALDNLTRIALPPQATKESLDRFDKQKKSELDRVESKLKMNKDFLGKEPKNQEARNYIRNRNIAEFNGVTGVGTGDPDGVLWVNTQEIRDDEDVKRMKKAEEEAKDTLGTTNDMIRKVDELEELMKTIQDTDPGYLNILANHWSWLGKGTNENSLLNEISKAPYINVRDEDGNVRKVNALRYAKQLVTSLQDNYDNVVLKGNRLTDRVIGHWKGIFFDPESLEDFRRGGVQGWLESIKGFRNLTNSRIVNELSTKGFVREPLEKKYPIAKSDFVKTGKATQADIARNPDKYKNKVR